MNGSQVVLFVHIVFTFIALAEHLPIDCKTGPTEMRAKSVAGAPFRKPTLRLLEQALISYLHSNMPPNLMHTQLLQV